MYKVLSDLKENGKRLKKGDEYKGDNAERLLSIGVIEKVNAPKPKPAKKVAKKKPVKKE